VPITLDSQRWPGTRAILLVHGIGNAAPGDYTALVAKVRAALGDQADTVAIYQLWYDEINDWFQEKTALADLLGKAVSTLKGLISNPALAPVVAEYAGDVLWPVLSANARAAVREIYLAQVKKMVKEGIDAGVPARRQELSIICHSLGCLHTYEALHHMALFPSHGLQPATHEVTFRNVIYMASPVQLIRTVSNKMGNLVPNKRWLYTVQGDALSIPNEATLTGMVVPSVARWASITGNLDPVGGFLLRDKQAWAYMDVAGQVSVIDEQRALNINSAVDLTTLLQGALRKELPPLVTPNDPHNWENYVTRNASTLKGWIVG
jgi:hypothetical protein